MNESLTSREKRRLRKIARDYEERGYKVIVHPSRGELPTFLQNVHPDMIAVGPEESVVVEVKTRRTLRDDKELEIMARRVEKRPGWRLELVLTNPQKQRVIGESTPLLAPNQLGKRLASVKELARNRDYGAALLIAWTVVESVLRSMADDIDERLASATPMRLSKDLLSLGLIHKTEHSLIEKTFEARNRVVHGYAGRRVTSRHVQDLTRLAGKLISRWLGV